MSRTTDVPTGVRGCRTWPRCRSRAGSRLILLADDNLDMRDYVERLLHAAGYRVEIAADGEAALAAIAP